MAQNSRSARREAIRQNRLYYTMYLRRFIAFAHNAVKFENLGDTPKRYIMRTLINYGAIAYDKETGLYLRFVPIGYDIYGLPQQYTLYGYNGYTVTRNPDEVVILRVNDIQEPIKPFLEIKAKRIVDYDLAILQNLEAIKTMTVYECSSDAQILSLVNQEESRRLGATVFFANKNAFGDTGIKASSTGAQYLVDKLQEAKQKELNEVYAALGTAVANTDKRERVQSVEVNTSLSYAKDSLFLNCDTFNYDAEYGGLKIRMKPNTSLIELWRNQNDNETDRVVKKETDGQKGKEDN